MLTGECRNWLLETLAVAYDPRELQSVVMILLQDITRKSPARLLGDPTEELSPLHEEKLRQAVARLIKHEPIQYVLGKADFYGLSLMVSQGVLIPRPETEELVEWIIAEESWRTNIQPAPLILDLGCGSGAITVALANRMAPLACCALDVSEEALELTKHNWSQLIENRELSRGSASALHLVQYDLLGDDPEPPWSESCQPPFDVMVSNPPYVLESQRRAMDKRVVDFEPGQALFVSDSDPLVFYRAIAAFAKKWLKKDGALYLEINNLLGDETCDLVGDYFPQVELRKDINGKDRMIRAAYG